MAMCIKFVSCCLLGVESIHLTQCPVTGGRTLPPDPVFVTGRFSGAFKVLSETLVNAMETCRAQGGEGLFVPGTQQERAVINNFIGKKNFSSNSIKPRIRI